MIRTIESGAATNQSYALPAGRSQFNSRGVTFLQPTGGYDGAHEDSRPPVRTCAFLRRRVLRRMAAAAFADEPAESAWPDGKDRSDLWLLVFFGGGTVGLFVIISLFALLTARNNYVPPAPGNEIHVRTDSSPAQHH